MDAPATPQDAPETTLQSITRTANALLPAFERAMGMTRARWRVLKRVFLESPLSQAALQAQIGVDAAAVTRQVKQLEAEGLVTRAADPRDNRFTLVDLTPAGREEVAGLLATRDRFEERVTAGLSAEELLVLRRCLGRIRRNLAALAAESDSAGPPGEPASDRA